jgi:hypothetical protein
VMAWWWRKVHGNFLEVLIVEKSSFWWRRNFVKFPLDRIWLDSEDENDNRLLLFLRVFKSPNDLLFLTKKSYTLREFRWTHHDGISSRVTVWVWALWHLRPRRRDFTSAAARPSSLACLRWLILMDTRATPRAPFVLNHAPFLRIIVSFV